MTFEGEVTITGRFRRGGEATMGGKWEIIGILNQALDNALSQMGEDLKTLCGHNGVQVHQ